ncbi:MAG: hypothetical protein FJW23_09430 [Acidimicrobiia bacterium]|nr:hypothetical protein [Acidimicrobiia bacterium]
MSALVVATDAGGAANVAPVAARLPESGRRVVCSEATEHFFREHGLANVVRWAPGQAWETLVDGLTADDVVLCGTTRYGAPDRWVTPAARGRGAHTVAVLDEWHRYADRFRDGTGQLAWVPDVICVPDELARLEAIEEGLPAGRLAVTGSPALSSWWTRLERFEREPPPLPAGVAGPRPWILFVSELHAVSSGTAPGTRGPWSGFLGFTEESVAADLAAVVAGLGRPCTVVEKLHPSAADGNSAMPGLPDSQAWIRIGHAPIEPLLWHADLIVGMRSIVLLEAAMTGRPVLSCQPGLTAEHGPATAERFGFVPRAVNPGELERWLRRNWRGARRTIPRPAFAGPDAVDRVLEVLRPVALAGER